ncbi:MAG: hypothetical protein L0Y71_21330 [Gemmataceae bacterium]|nr:hypothetical protein [Gemmataceae bacterium]
MIGGCDQVLWVDEKAPAADVIVRAVRRHWPDFVFQNVDDDQPITPDSDLWLPSPTGREFFLYENAASAQGWLAQGATPENRNAMIHVILGNRRNAALGLRSITLVSGAWTGILDAILSSIRTDFEEFVESHPPALKRAQ